MGYLVSEAKEGHRFLGFFLWFGKKRTNHKMECISCDGVIVKNSFMFTVLSGFGRYPQYSHLHRRCFLLALKETLSLEADNSLAGIKGEDLEDITPSIVLKKLRR